jgi:hypothetical protein
MKPILAILTLLLGSTASMGGECTNCDGARMLGPGPVKFVCPICEGTGETAGPAHPAPSASAVAPKSQAAEGPAAASGLSADQQPTPLPTIAAAINAMKPRVGDVFVDFGCGPDARACIVAARDCGLDAIGIEIDAVAADEARRVVAANGLSHKITIITGDATKIDVPSATIGFAYLWPDTLAALKPRLSKLRAFASFAHAVPGLATERRGDVYVWHKPNPTAVMQAFRQAAPRQPVAVWKGATYTRRQCSNPACSMCRAIESQLRSGSSGGHYEMRCSYDRFGRRHCQRVWIPN